MKSLKYLIWFILLTHIDAPAQMFTQLATGDVVNTPSDSRSVNLVDVNQDGWDDIFITNGPGSGAPNFLYLNNGNGTFTTITGDDIVSDTSSFDGASFADVDNDGDLDAYAVTWYNKRNYFYQNNGNGTFTQLPNAILGNQGTYSETASWGDYDGDGLVDLYITNSGGNKVNQLFQNQGNSTFTQVQTGFPATETHSSRNVSWVDYDFDRDPDLMVTNENGEANDLYRNNGQGTFTKLTNTPPTLGLQSSMGCSWGDVDNDGDLDLFVANANFQNELDNQFFLNDGQGNFTAASGGLLDNDGGCSYSSSFMDYDNDGDLDLFVTNGFCYANTTNFMYDNDGTGNFTRSNLTMSAIPGNCTYGAAWADLDHNGFPDLVLATCIFSSSPFPVLPSNFIFMNQGNSNHWLNFNLEGTTSNRSAIGARVYLSAEINGQTVVQMREITAQSGYCSENSLTVHFGLGASTTINYAVIEWPAGGNTTINNPPSDTTLWVTEGTANNLEDAAAANAIGLAFSRDSNSGLGALVLKNPDRLQMRSIQVLNLQGKSMFQTELNHSDKQQRLPLPKLPGGIYLVHLKTDQGQKVSKFWVD